MFNNKKKKAFTLTELLIVVIIIGVLAAVVLPKFNEMMETRKTTEAEEMMAAVRTEQEYRCAMDKPYAGETRLLSSVDAHVQASGKSVITKNYTYELEPFGILARSSSKAYNLKMPSYADGRICCEGDDCNNLSKDYPKCLELEGRSDFLVSAECKTEPPTPGQGCAGVPQKFRSCPEGCGTQSRTATCNSGTGEWEYSAWSPACEEKLPDVTEDCECGHRTKTAQCNTSTGHWEYGTWDRTCTGPETETEDCDEGDGEKTRTQICDEELGKWTYNGAEWDTSSCEQFIRCYDLEEEATWAKYSNGTVPDLEHYCYSLGQDYDRGSSEVVESPRNPKECCISCGSGAGFVCWDDEGKERCDCVHDLFEPQVSEVWKMDYYTRSANEHSVDSNITGVSASTSESGHLETKWIKPAPGCTDFMMSGSSCPNNICTLPEVTGGNEISSAEVDGLETCDQANPCASCSADQNTCSYSCKKRNLGTIILDPSVVRIKTQMYECYTTNMGERECQTINETGHSQFDSIGTAYQFCSSCPPYSSMTTYDMDYNAAGGGNIIHGDAPVDATNFHGIVSTCSVPTIKRAFEMVTCKWNEMYYRPQ